MRLAGEAGAPVVGFVESGGARLQEGHDALAGYGRIFRASVELAERVPQISIVTGVSAGGGAYSPALTDFVVMTEAARMFLTGPRVVRGGARRGVTMEELGGPGVHSRNGVCQLVAARRRGCRSARPARCSACCRSRLGDRAPAPPGPAVHDRRRTRSRLGPGRARARVYDVRDVAPRDLRRRQPARALARLGAQHGHRACPDRRAAGRRGRQPAATPRRRDRRRGGREGGAVRRRLRPLRPAARRPRRHPRVHARHAARSAAV